MKAMLIRDVMTTGLMTLHPDAPVFEAITHLLKHRVSGAPVTDDHGKLVGIISEKDCLRIFANEAFFNEGAGGLVKDFMSSDVVTIDSDADVFAAADIFLKSSFRRLPVIEEGQLVGQVSRRDILGASLQILGESPVKKKWTDAKYITDEIQAALSNRKSNG